MASSHLKRVNILRDRGVLVAKRRSVVAFGFALGRRVSKVSTVSGIGGSWSRNAELSLPLDSRCVFASEMQNGRHFWTCVGPPRLRSGDSLRDRGAPGWETLKRRERRERREERTEEREETRKERDERGEESEEKREQRRGERKEERRGERREERREEKGEEREERDERRERRGERGERREEREERGEEREERGGERRERMPPDLSLLIGFAHGVLL